MVACVTGGTTLCTFGTMPNVLRGTSSLTTLIGGVPACVVADGAPFANIGPFGMCSSLTNPAVASATAAALGVLTPQPCTPVTAAWIPAQFTVLVGGQPCLTLGSTCMCAYLGVINIVQPGQFTVLVG